jgi:hypothetical protein
VPIQASSKSWHSAKRLAHNLSALKAVIESLDGNGGVEDAALSSISLLGVTKEQLDWDFSPLQSPLANPYSVHRGRSHV